MICPKHNLSTLNSDSCPECDLEKMMSYGPLRSGIVFFGKTSYSCDVCGKEYPIPGLCDECLPKHWQGHKGFRVVIDGREVAHVRSEESARAVLRLMKL
jgi:hypothetical protein